jgi:dTDP-4-dehydrorhamnose reductase
VLGSDGQVGLSLCQLMDSRKIPYVALTTEECSVSKNIISAIQSNIEFPFVMNTLFEEPPEGANPDLQHWLSTCEQIAHSCHELDKTLFHLSSSLVFSGKSTRAYTETDECDSTSPLGRAFQLLEEKVLEINPNSVILRASWLFSEQVDNFLTRLVGAAISSESLQVSGNLRGCPTDAHAVAKVFVGMAEQIDCGTSSPSLSGIYHYADSDACSMHTFAKTVITVVKSMAEVRVETIEEGDTPGMIDAVIELENYELSCKKILSTFGIKQRPWRRSVHEVLKEKFSSQS